MIFTQNKEGLKIEFEEDDTAEERRMVEDNFDYILNLLRILHHKKDSKVKNAW